MLRAFFCTAHLFWAGTQRRRRPTEERTVFCPVTGKKRQVDASNTSNNSIYGVVQKPNDFCPLVLLSQLPGTMQYKPDDARGTSKDHIRPGSLAGPTDDDYKGLYDDLMTLRQSWELLDPEDPAQWDRDGVPRIAEDSHTRL